MAKDVERHQSVDPTWPEGVEHPVTELNADRAGSLSPFGDVEFPVREVPYHHPKTVINK